MNRRRFLQVAIGGGGSVLLGTAGPMVETGGSAAADVSEGQSDVSGKWRRLTRKFRALGTEMSLTVRHGDESVASRAADAAIREIQRVDVTMSVYQPQSDLSKLNQRGSITAPDPYLIDVLRAAQNMSRRTDGAFDVTVQPLWTLYSEASREGRTPASSELDAMKRRIDWRRIEVLPDRIRLNGAEMAVTLNGIAQGYAADRAIAALRQHGITRALVNAGEVAPLGQKADAEPWTAGIQHPRREDAYLAVAPLDGRCLATSGDYASPFSKDFRFNHLFDPRTGRSPEYYASVSVVAPSATLADALSTALYVLPPDRAMTLIRSTSGTDAMFVLKTGRVLITSGFPS